MISLDLKEEGIDILRPPDYDIHIVLFMREVDWLAFYGGMIRVLRVLARPFTFLHERPDLSRIPEPAVFICRHRNMRGPIFTMLHLDRQVHPWVFSVFCDRQSCYEHFRDYTFGVRLKKWPNFVRRALPHVLSVLEPALTKSMGAIPVYRQSLKVRVTFRQSMDALSKGESVILYPDINYVDTSDAPGEMYSGYLLMGQMYYKATGKKLSFVPLDIRMNKRAILLGDPVEFDGSLPFQQERERCADAIKSELTKLGQQV